jgi:hypothetical protein
MIWAPWWAHSEEAFTNLDRAHDHFAHAGFSIEAAADPGADEMTMRRALLQRADVTRDRIGVATDTYADTGRKAEPRRPCGSRRGNGFLKWAWGELNYRPHAYQAHEGYQKSGTMTVFRETEARSADLCLHTCRTFDAQRAKERAHGELRLL